MTARGLVLLVLAACSSTSARVVPKGHVVVALTIDWEGAELSAEEFEALDGMRKQLGDVPMTHFMSAAYFTRDELPPAVVRGVQDAVRPEDELAVHLHAWQSLVTASHVSPKVSPSFLSGNNDLAEFDSGDVGFETDLDAYTVAELRAVLRTSREVLQRLHHPIARSFRAGGYLATPKMLEAVESEGFDIDSSAIDYRQLKEVPNPFWLDRISQLWPKMDPTKQPYLIDGGAVLEMPIAAVADYVNVDDIYEILSAALGRLRRAPDTNIFVVLASHFETGPDYCARLQTALARLHAERDELVFTTVGRAAELARSTLPRPFASSATP